MGFYDAFFGSDQSQYTAYAIVAAIIAICITILLTATDIPVSNRLLIVFFVIISLVPSVFLTLFELTCIVTGGTEPNKWWCYAFAWVLAAFIIIYCIFIVIISLISLFTYNNAIDNIKETEDKGRLSPEVSNNYAKQMIANEDSHAKQVEKFYNDSMMNDMLSGNMLNEAIPNNNKETNVMSDMTAMSSMTASTGEEAFKNNEYFEAPKKPVVSQFTNDISTPSPQKPQISAFTGMQNPMKAQFSNYGGASSDDDVSDGFFAYDKFTAN
jgi:magnesium-transporting ATPase (P-type)